MAVTLRPAQPSDEPALGRMGAALAQLHHDFDPQRFMMPDDVESGYRWWLGREAKKADAVVIVAEMDGEVVGYAYGRVEAVDWNALLDRSGGFHDLWVDAKARKAGVGAQLAEELMRRLTALGVPRVVLHTAAKNEAAQRMFARLGWRPTMVEMTREATADTAPKP
ncbi:GNAT family N-acetyltransferase [Myxococcus sp. K38C18041901]|uniref:GNAT family N-acetyltransferase n=1 Tax=Myxococcus guangdongensis TaxID=2906760 RepID=UPI0020A7AB81|nr:GNAT family N-acetyltransferase [Myxococcus guangdongensis]MCP3060450.1 GNAT family N-acetyltransferase [Myxococcus guangdongensis]